MLGRICHRRLGISHLINNDFEVVKKTIMNDDARQLHEKERRREMSEISNSPNEQAEVLPEKFLS